jgi:2-oxoisovalerate dehydrogenase E1 component
MVPENYFTEEIGKAKLVRAGNDLTIITYGAGVHWALDFLHANPAVSASVLDLRTLLPFDTDSIAEAVKQTGKVLLLHEDTLTGGIGGEISAWITENLFEHLDAPVLRCASLDTPVPFALELEKNFLANNFLSEKVNRLLNY